MAESRSMQLHNSNITGSKSTTLSAFASQFCGSNSIPSNGANTVFTTRSLPHKMLPENFQNGLEIVWDIG